MSSEVIAPTQTGAHRPRGAQVAFLTGITGLGFLFYLNQLVNAIFFIDMVQTFFLPFHDEHDGNRLVRDKASIAKHCASRAWTRVIA